MTHHTLISSAPAAFAFSSASHLLHASSSSSPTLSPSSGSSSSSSAQASASAMSTFAHHHGSLQVETDGGMSALRSSLRPYEAAEEVAAAVVSGPAAWGAGLLGDGFSVEELLDLEELCEGDKDSSFLCEAAPAAEEEEQKCSDSHGSSAVSYELMPLVPPEMDLPAHDAEELEWVSRIMDDSQAELPPPPPPPQLPAAAWPPQQHRRPQESAVSAVDPMRTPTICALSTEALVPVRSKKRSKRSRGTTVWSLSGASISDSASSSATTSSCSSSASLSSFFLLDSPTFNLLDEPPRAKKSKHKPKKRGRKPKNHFAPQLSGGPASPPPAHGERRCSHCGVQKTPQWRAGPEGAKTLCNACGVRFKSGRLLPEYRPACSPTFVGDLHSNSHRKVLEMRRKKDPVPVIIETAAAAAPAVASF